MNYGSRKSVDILIAVAIVVVGFVGFLGLPRRADDSLSDPGKAGELARLRSENLRLREARATRIRTHAEYADSPMASSGKPALIRQSAAAYIADFIREGYMVADGTLPYVRSRDQLERRPSYTLGNDGFPMPGFADFYGLSPDESERLNQRLKTLKASIQEAVLKEVRARAVDDGSIAIEVPAVEQSQELATEFAGIFREVLGADRYRTFALMHGDQEIGLSLGGTLSNRFGAFGREALSISVTKHGGAYKFRLTSTKSDGSVTASSGNAANLEELSAAIGPAAAALPGGF